MSREQTILDTIADMVTDFLDYDRREDGELGVGEIENAVSLGEITVEEMVYHFARKLREGLS